MGATVRKAVVLVVMVGFLALTSRSISGEPVAQGRTVSLSEPESAAAAVNPRQTSERLAFFEAMAEAGNTLHTQLPPLHRQLLSSGGQRLMFLAEHETAFKEFIAPGVPLSPSNLERLSLSQLQQPLAADLANDPMAFEDFLSRMFGNDQAEPSVAWCGNNAVIGYNDGGSESATRLGLFSPSGSLSRVGWSLSATANSPDPVFEDRGPLIPDPLPAGIAFSRLLGDPVVGCTSPSTFYFSSLALDAAPGIISSGVWLSKSTDGGSSWNGAVPAVRKGFPRHFLDKEWMAVHPGPTDSPDDNVIFLTYTDFDVTRTSAACPGTLRTAVEFVRSLDGGKTWSSPLVMEQPCGFGSAAHHSLIGVGLDGPVDGVGDLELFVAWVRFQRDGITIRMRKSTNAGATFGQPVTVSDIVRVGNGFLLQGFFRSGAILNGLAVDRSSGPANGHIYISWHDGRNRRLIDPLGSCAGRNTYCFGNVLLSKSTDGGATWSQPATLNLVNADQWQPALSVDSGGDVWVLYYDRRRDPRNLMVEVFLAKSTDGGVTWTNSLVSKVPFAPVVGPRFYMGDYIGLATDATGANPGVIAAWSDGSIGDLNVMFAKR